MAPSLRLRRYALATAATLILGGTLGAMLAGCVSTARGGAAAPGGATAEKREPTATPPGGLKPEEVPQFVVLGFDDNAYSGLPESGKAGGMTFAVELFEGRKNPAGSGKGATFDGAPARASFYMATRPATTPVNEEPAMIRKAWMAARDAGHEIGLHTHTHPHGHLLTPEQWQREMKTCEEFLAGAEGAQGLGVKKDRLVGFRTPYLEYNDATFAVLEDRGVRYDCSIEEGYEDGHDGKNYFWPYTLHEGSPGNQITVGWGTSKKVGQHPGVWEIPVYALVAPPDGECEKYGIEPGLRARMKQAQDYFDVSGGKVTGIDWNLWVAFRLNEDEVVGILKYNLDRRLAGNRAPFTFGTHSDIYSDAYEGEIPNATPAQRRNALKRFLDDALSRPEVRVVPAADLLTWLEKPTAL